jgi:hypothetical protein
MVPDIIPFMIPRVEWASLLKTAQDALGYSPVKALDACPRTLSESAKFLVVAASFQDRDLKDALTALRDSLDLLAHLHFAFLVYADDETVKQVMERTDLKITMTNSVDGERIAIASGNLKQWYTATLTCCTERQPYNLRVLFDKVVLFFEKAGLAELWHGSKKRALPDRTFLLEYK